MVIAKNPILSGFYPDPSICRVGNDFLYRKLQFCICTWSSDFSQQRFSTLGADWKYFRKQRAASVEKSEISRGIFAPTIRYHEGLFYMITTNVSYGGNFIVTAKNPEGPWSEPYYLGEEAIGIDPSLFFDDDGRCYYCGTRPNPEGVRYNGDWGNLGSGT